MKRNLCHKQTIFTCQGYDVPDMETCLFFEENIRPEEVAINRLRACRYLDNCRCICPEARGEAK